MEKLYNGIEIPAAWPPRNMDDHSLRDLPVPYLTKPPKVIDISVGRQLFVDDFLIDETTMEKRFHQAVFSPDSPVLQPETPLEMSGGIAPMAAPFTDGCWFDPMDGLYKLWYHAGWMEATGLAVSRDGVQWTRKMLDNRPGTNMVDVPPKGWRRDGSTIWLDAETENPAERYKMFTFYRTPEGEFGVVQCSHDGLHWGRRTQVGDCGDNTSFFYNPFRKKWIFSIRKGMPLFERYSRARRYYECDDFMEQAHWQQGDDVFWQRCDETDLRECEFGVRYSSLMPPQLYHLNCVAYESVMLGLFGIIKGFDEYDNSVCENLGAPKKIDLHVAFSRDGFHFSRDNRLPFIRATGKENDWNRGYLHACGGICLIEGDRLLFPVGGFSGRSPANGGNLYGDASTGFATLRRDGFASLHANWSRQYVVTKPLTFAEGRKCLFVNANAIGGFVAAEVLDEQGNVLPGFSMEECISAQNDSTKQQIRFVGGHSLAELAGRPVRLRFCMTNADLFSFWLAEDERGASKGFVAAGGPNYCGNRDL